MYPSVLLLQRSMSFTCTRRSYYFNGLCRLHAPVGLTSSTGYFFSLVVVGKCQLERGSFLFAWLLSLWKTNCVLCKIVRVLELDPTSR